MRYIDADELMQKLSRMIDYCGKDPKVSGLTALFQVGDAIMDCPTADVVEVVRCKDCVNLYKGEFQSTCRYATYIYSMDDYCSHGERKDDE
jgi:hypothetical protein